MPYTAKQRRFTYAQAKKGVAWARKEVASGAAKVIHATKKTKKRLPKK